jgi:hypothetical protein
MQYPLIGKNGELSERLPIHPFFDKRRNARRSVGREELEGLSKEWQAH